MKKDEMKEMTEALLKIGECLQSTLVPEKSITHFRRATKEVLLGLAALIDVKDKPDSKDGDSKSQDENAAKSQKIDIT